MSFVCAFLPLETFQQTCFVLKVEKACFAINNLWNINHIVEKFMHCIEKIGIIVLWFFLNNNVFRFTVFVTKLMMKYYGEKKICNNHIAIYWIIIQGSFKAVTIRRMAFAPCPVKWSHFMYMSSLGCNNLLFFTGESFVSFSVILLLLSS